MRCVEHKVIEARDKLIPNTVRLAVEPSRKLPVLLLARKRKENQRPRSPLNSG